MGMAFVICRTTVSGSMTSAACAMVLGPSSAAAVPCNLSDPATVRGISSTPWASAAVTAPRTWMEMGSAIPRRFPDARVHWLAITSQTPRTTMAPVNSLLPASIVTAIVSSTRMETESVTRMRSSAAWTKAPVITSLPPPTTWAVSTPLSVTTVKGTASGMPTTMAYATPMRSRGAPTRGLQLSPGSHGRIRILRLCHCPL